MADRALPPPPGQFARGDSDVMRPAAIAPHPQQQQQQQHKPLINRFETETHRLEDDVRKEVDKMTGYEGIVAVGTAALLYFLALLEGALYIGTVIQLEYQAGLATPAVVLFFGAFFILFYRDQAISLGSVVVILSPLLVPRIHDQCVQPLSLRRHGKNSKSVVHPVPVVSPVPVGLHPGEDGGRVPVSFDNVHLSDNDPGDFVRHWCRCSDCDDGGPLHQGEGGESSSCAGS